MIHDLPSSSTVDKLNLRHMMLYKKNKKTLGIDGIAAMLLYIISISPPLRVGIPYYVEVSALCMTWILITLNTHSEFYLRPSRTTLAIMTSFIGITVMMILFGNIVFWKLEVGLFLYYVFVMMFSYYQKYEQAKLFWFFWIILTILPIWSFTTLRALFLNPYAARDVREGNVDPTLNFAGVGGYGHIYMCTIIAVCCVVMLLKAKNYKWWKRFLLLVNVCMGFVQILISGYTLSVIVVLVALASTIFLKKNKQGRPRIRGFVILTIVLIIVLGNLNTICLYLLRASFGTSHYYKITDFILFLNTGKFGETFTGRFNLYNQSLETAIKYWYGGIVTIPHLQLTTDIYGWHSTILDAYAMFGILFGTLNACILFTVPFNMSRNNKYKSSSLPISILIGLIFLLIFDNATETIAISTTVVLFCSSEYICRNHTEINRKL